MAEDPADPEAYDLAPDPRRAVVLPVAQRQGPRSNGLHSPGPQAPGPLSYRSRPASPSGFDPGLFRDLHMPLWLLGGGVVIEVAGALFRKPTPKAVFLDVGVNLIAGTAIMLMGILLAARWRGLDLGSFWTAVLKLAAIAVVPAALGTALTPLLRLIPLGGLLGLAGEFVLYFALLGALFDLDQDDTWYCVLVIFLVRLAVFFTLIVAVMKWA